jgi:hypothetical protein
LKTRSEPQFNWKEAMKMGIDVSEFAATETLVAISKEEALKLL